MKILLLSENATIQKLFSLSVEKRGDEIFIGDRNSVPENNYQAVFIDKELFSEELLKNLKDSFKNAKFILILNKKDEKIPGFDDFIYKPFLPTDLIEFLDNLFSEKKEKQNDEFDLESFDDFSVDDLDEEDENFLIDDDELDEEVEEKENEDDFLISDDDFLEDEQKEDEPEMENLDEGGDILEEDVLDEDFESEESSEPEEKFDLEEEGKDLDEGGDILEEDVLDEDFEPEENEMLDSDLLEEAKNEMSDDEDKKSDNQNNEFDFDELENINEKELAEAVGEDIGEELEEMENKNNEENDILEEKGEDTEKEEVKSDCESMKKTLGNILNINWEELKKAKAKVTITIDFGG